MAAIHSAKAVLGSTGHSRETDMQHQQRQERLAQIRKQMDELKA
jgi:hypothetical protein